MPTIDEKLEILNRMILEDATKSRDAVLDQLKRDAEQKLADSKAVIAREAAEAYSRETLRAIQEKDARISRANIGSRKVLMAARNDIIASVLADLAERLKQFTETKQYREYLIKNVRETLDITGGSAAAAVGAVAVIVTPKDYEKYGAELRATAPGLTVLQGDVGMIGGCRAENPAARVYVDNSLEKKVELSVDELFKISGLTI